MLLFGRVVVRWVRRADRDDMARLVRQAETLDDEIRIARGPSLMQFLAGQVHSGVNKLQARFAPSRVKWGRQGPKQETSNHG